MADAYAVLNLESRTVVATGIDPHQAHQLALVLPPTLVAADESTMRRIQEAWRAPAPANATAPAFAPA